PDAASALPTPPRDPLPTGEERTLLAHQRSFADLEPTVPRSARTRVVLAALATLAPQAAPAPSIPPSCRPWTISCARRSPWSRSARNSRGSTGGVRGRPQRQHNREVLSL